MKYSVIITFLALATALLGAACSDDATESYPFTLDTDRVEIGPDGGNQAIKISSTGRWNATSDATWIKLYPANGVGPMVCKLQIDSSVLANESRQAVMQIVSDDQMRPLQFSVTQTGYQKLIALDEASAEIELPSYGDYGKRTFDVKVTTNVPFKVTLPKQPWVEWQKIDIASHLNRGARPRTITLHFTWENNTRPEQRDMEIVFTPEAEEELGKLDKLAIKQIAADKLVEGVQGDSLAILACQRSLNCAAFDTNERMANWTDVTLWEESDPEMKEHPDWVGRVRTVKFKSSNTKEKELPFEIQYLTATEQVSFFSNVNKFMKNMSTGPYLSMLTQLKRLQIYSMGLVELDKSFVNLKNLEQLDLGGNNFEQIPAILTPTNFPKLTYLDLVNNRRHTILGSNMETTTRPKEDWGGFYKGNTGYGSSPLYTLFKWEKLELLRLSMNYLQNGINFDTKNMPKYTANDEYWAWDPIKRDSVWHKVPTRLVGTPKVLPNATYLAINGNFLSGELPDWLLYHPHLMKWSPSVLIFPQAGSGFDEKGNAVGFTNVPIDPAYYYVAYPEQDPDNWTKK